MQPLVAWEGALVDAFPAGADWVPGETPCCASREVLGQHPGTRNLVLKGNFPKPTQTKGLFLL